jgi:hypothetical protein
MSCQRPTAYTSRGQTSLAPYTYKLSAPDSLHIVQTSVAPYTYKLSAPDSLHIARLDTPCSLYL